MECFKALDQWTNNTKEKSRNLGKLTWPLNAKIYVIISVGTFQKFFYYIIHNKVLSKVLLGRRQINALIKTRKTEKTQVILK